MVLTTVRTSAETSLEPVVISQVPLVGSWSCTNTYATMIHRVVGVVLGAFTAIAIFACFRASIQAPGQLSPQGCRMSYMSPSYILQSDFNASWTSLSGRYSLWLYREVGWENNQV